MEKIERDSFVFYRSFYECFKKLEPKDVKDLLLMICSYCLDDQQISNDNYYISALFEMFKGNLDSSNKRYKASVENGKKGGNPNFKKGVSNPYYKDNLGITQDNQKITKTLPKDNQKITQDNLGVIEKGVLIEKETDKEKEKENTLINPLKEKEKEINKEKDFIPQKVYILALSLIDGTEYGVTQEEIDSYQQLYPAVNVEQEYRNMAGWLLSNPKYRKTRRGISRFINGWLVKRQDKSYGNGNYYKKNYNYQPKQEIKPDKVCEENEILTEEEILAMIGE